MTFFCKRHRELGEPITVESMTEDNLTAVITSVQFALLNRV